MRRNQTVFSSSFIKQDKETEQFPEYFPSVVKSRECARVQTYLKRRKIWCISTIFFEIGLKWFRYFGVKETGGRTAGGRDENDCEWAELTVLVISISMVFGVVSRHKGSISIFSVDLSGQAVGFWALSAVNGAERTPCQCRLISFVCKNNECEITLCTDLFRRALIVLWARIQGRIWICVYCFCVCMGVCSRGTH